MSVQLSSDQVNINTGGGGLGGYCTLATNGVNGGGSSALGFEMWSINSNGLYGSSSISTATYQGDYLRMMPSNGEEIVYDPFNYNGGGLGSLYIGGFVYQNWYSDAKYKDNVTQISNALEKVNAIRGVEFDWNNLANEEQGKSGHDVGVIAQEVQAVYPIAVREVDKEREDHVVSALAVDYEKLIPLLLQSIKELSAEVNSLKQQINGTNI